MPLWWISWYSAAEHGPFELNTPWWVSGWSERGDTIVAVVRAGDSAEAKQKIVDAYDDKYLSIVDFEWRFCDEWGELIFTDRFPRADWMIDP